MKRRRLPPRAGARGHPASPVLETGVAWSQTKWLGTFSQLGLTKPADTTKRIETHGTCKRPRILLSGTYTTDATGNGNATRNSSNYKQKFQQLFKK